MIALLLKDAEQSPARHIYLLEGPAVAYKFGAKLTVWSKLAF